ncbi:hypothetical protein [Providencia sp. PROV077]|uniref:hypothetical protein n=1 Tax=Providencia sp. PROV077 TaxID=2949799 RepID=UPI002349151C|nr:hypothetical protein [Providencia sp. PROV077]
MKKEPKGSFGSNPKEPVIERVFQLVDRYPSRSAAARAWDINVNTLKNYYTRRDIEPVPRKTQLVKIAETEGVSLDWLLHGIGEKPNTNSEIKTSDVNHEVKGKSMSRPIETKNDKLTELLSLLTDEEKNQLYESVARKGMDSILQLIFEFASLSPSEFDRAIRLAKQVKEGASEGGSEDIITHPTQNQVG